MCKQCEYFRVRICVWTVFCHRQAHGYKHLPLHIGHDESYLLERHRTAGPRVHIGEPIQWHIVVSGGQLQKQPARQLSVHDCFSNDARLFHRHARQNFRQTTQVRINNRTIIVVCDWLREIYYIYPRRYPFVDCDIVSLYNIVVCLVCYWKIKNVIRFNNIGITLCNIRLWIMNVCCSHIYHINVIFNNLIWTSNG